MLAVFSLSSVSASGTFDIDDDRELDALTDGLLILRHLFGFSGSTLTMMMTTTVCPMLMTSTRLMHRGVLQGQRGFRTSQLGV